MSGITKIIGDWWAEYLGDRDSASCRGAAARLRRATSPVDVAAEPTVQILAQRLGRRQAVLPVAQALAELRGNHKDSMAWRMGPGLTDPAVSAARFERLIRTPKDGLVPAIRRVLPLVDRECDAGRLGADILYWNEATRVRWTFDYYRTEMPGGDADSAAKKEVT